MALSNATFTDAGSAVSDIFAGIGDEYKAEGAQFEEERYTDAAQLAGQEAQFSETSTAIQTAQAERNLFTSIGATKAGVAGAGFGEGGSALDILRSSAQEGATTAAVDKENGMIQTAGYQEQQTSYNLMASAAQVDVQAEKEAATGSFISAGIQGLASIASLFTGGIVGAAAGAGGGFTPEAPADPSAPLIINQYAPPAPQPQGPSGIY
jgi:hypothetical protein